MRGKPKSFCVSGEEAHDCGTFADNAQLEKRFRASYEKEN
jgi:hypothetical protein